MTKYFGAAMLLFFGALAPYVSAHSAESTVPAPFRDFDPNSTCSINYDDLTAVLRTAVVDVGLSTRKEAAPAEEITGTRMKPKVKKTANEGNRFYFESVKDDEDFVQFMIGIQKSLEELPANAPLKYFSRDEQLAYWLNLYNITVLNQIIEIYPKNNLKKYTVGKRSIFSKKLLNVAGVPLSLNDIEFTILKQNYDNNPLVLYGLYKGIIGGPSIRRRAFTGNVVYEDLENNAYEFINSNRGTYIRDEKTFRVSSLYAREKSWFPDFNDDLSTHLMAHLRGQERTALESATKIKADINDWTVTDLGGSQARIGGSFADSRAALLDSVKGTTPADGGGVMAAAVGNGSSMITQRGKQRSLERVDPALMSVLEDMAQSRLEENRRNATVTIDELEDEPEKPAVEAEPAAEEQNP
jgi:hypothetical protein